MQLLRGGVVGQPDGELHRLAQLHAGIVGDGLLHEHGVWHRNQKVVPGADAGGAHGNVFDEAFPGGGLNVVTHVEGLVRDNLETGKEVGGCILRCQGQGQTGKAETGNNTVNVVPHFGNENHRQQGHNDNADDDAHEANGHFRGLLVFLIVLDEEPGEGRGVVQETPGNEGDVRNAEELVHKGEPLGLRCHNEHEKLDSQSDEEHS